MLMILLSTNHCRLNLSLFCNLFLHGLLILAHSYLIVEFMLLANAWSVADKMLLPCVNWETLQAKGHLGCLEGEVTCCGISATFPTTPIGALVDRR